MGTELLYPLSGRLVDTWEWVERAGDYMLPLALIAAIPLLHAARKPHVRLADGPARS